MNRIRFHKTRKGAAQHVKDLLVRDAMIRHDVPQRLFIITNYRPGKRPNWEVAEIAPIGQERFYGPIHQGNVQELTEALGVEWRGILPAWIGAPIDRPYSHY